MKIIDANIILRYLMEDNAELLKKSEYILENHRVLILNEVLAEVIYVLEKFYKINRVEIKDGLSEFFENNNVLLEKADIAKTALKLFAERKFDFVDCILYAYSVEEKAQIETFDEKLKKVIAKGL